MTEDEKHKELQKYRDLNLATLDYLILKMEQFPTKGTSHLIESFKGLQTEVHVHFEKGRLTRLKQWFKDFTESPREMEDFEFDKYIKEKTGHDIDIHRRFKKRIDNILKRKTIRSENEFRDVESQVGKLCQTEPVDKEMIETLNGLLSEFHQSLETKN